MSAKDAGMRAKDATMSAKDATMSATDANINAEKATMTAKNATTSAKAAIKVYHRSPYPKLSRMSVVMPEGVADFGRHESRMDAAEIFKTSSNSTWTRDPPSSQFRNRSWTQPKKFKNLRTRGRAPKNSEPLMDSASNPKKELQMDAP